MNSDQQLVLVYFLAWIITFLVYFKKRRKFDVSCFIMITYIVYAISSFLLYNTTYISFNPLPLKIFPFLYLFVMLLVGLIPFMRFNSRSINIIYQPSRRLLNLFCLIFIISTLIHFPAAIQKVSEGFQIILLSSSGGLELYEETVESGTDAGHSISNFAAVISNSFAQVGFLLTIYYLTLEKKNKWMLLALFVSCVMKMLNGVATGQRGAIVEPLLVLAATFFMFKDYMKPIYKKTALAVGSLLIAILAVPLIFLTISRFDNKVSDPLESTYYYLGIENINFNNYALDDNGIRYGDRTIPLFKRLVGFQNVPKNFFERREKYPNLKINDNSFITYVGDIAIDYGPIITVILLCFLSYIITKSTRPLRNRFAFHQLLLLHFWLYLCVIGGIKLFPYADTGGNLKIIVFILTYMVFKLDYNNRLKTYNYG